MAQKIFDNQTNYGWGLSFEMTGKAPAIAKRIFDKLSDAESFVNDYNDSAIEGLTLSVVGDEQDKNGLYFVSKIGTASVADDGVKTPANDGVLVKLVDINKFNDAIDSFELINIVTSLPEGENIKEDVIYLVKDNDSPAEENSFIEYVWINNKWEIFGTFKTDTNLDGYYTSTETDEKINKAISETTETFNNQITTIEGNISEINDNLTNVLRYEVNGSTNVVNKSNLTIGNVEILTGDISYVLHIEELSIDDYTTTNVVAESTGVIVGFEGPDNGDGPEIDNTNTAIEFVITDAGEGEEPDEGFINRKLYVKVLSWDNGDETSNITVARSWDDYGLYDISAYAPRLVRHFTQSKSNFNASTVLINGAKVATLPDIPTIPTGIVTVNEHNVANINQLSLKDDSYDDVVTFFETSISNTTINSEGDYDDTGLPWSFSSVSVRDGSVRIDSSKTEGSSTALEVNQDGVFISSSSYGEEVFDTHRVATVDMLHDVIEVDTELSKESTNAISNKAVTEEFEKVREDIADVMAGDVASALKGYISKSESLTINGSAIYTEITDDTKPTNIEVGTVRKISIHGTEVSKDETNVDLEVITDVKVKTDSNSEAVTVNNNGVATIDISSLLQRISALEAILEGVSKDNIITTSNISNHAITEIKSSNNDIGVSTTNGVTTLSLDSITNISWGDAEEIATE